MARHYSTSHSAQLATFDVARADNLALRAAKASCDGLLRAQLRTGQHLLPFALAKALGKTVGLKGQSVRAAANDPTIQQGSRA